MGVGCKKKESVSDDFDVRILVWGWGALEADFTRFYQMDLYEALYIDKITSRRLGVLISGLPQDSAWVRFISDKDNYSLPHLLT